MSCSQKANVTLNADEVFLLEYYYEIIYEDSLENYEWKVVISGLTQIQHDFSTEIIRQKSYQGHYAQDVVVLSNSSKHLLNNLIRAYTNDSVFNLVKEEWADSFDCGPGYIFIIRKMNESICLMGSREFFPEDLKELVYEVYTKQSKSNMRLVVNQDSIQSVLKNFEKYIDAPNIPLPIKLKSTIPFQPPVIK